MDIIYWLIPLTLIILAVAIKIFFWAVKDGQFNDLDSPAISILLDDDHINPPMKMHNSNAQNNKASINMTKNSDNKNEPT